MQDCCNHLAYPHRQNRSSTPPADLQPPRSRRNGVPAAALTQLAQRLAAVRRPKKQRDPAKQGPPASRVLLGIAEVSKSLSRRHQKARVLHRLSGVSRKVRDEAAGMRMLKLKQFAE